MLPVARSLVTMLARLPLVFVIDGSTVRRDSMCLMLSVLYHRRALPLTWVVVEARKGHLPQALHCALLTQVVPLVPADAEVTILGDGEFDGTTWLADITARGWRYVCRTASDILVTAADVTFTMRELRPTCGETVAVEPAAITAARYGPVAALAVWEASYDEPIYLVTTHTDLEYAEALYRRRATIETYFSDQKSRGFRINRSHLRDPGRLARLLIATTLAYLWVVYLGVIGRRDALRKRIHRLDRCDLSLFSLGLRLLAYCLRHRHPLPRGVPKALAVARLRALTCSVRQRICDQTIEEVYLHDYGSPREARQGITRYMTLYNGQRPHQALDYRTPAAVYFAAPFWRAGASGGPHDLPTAAP